MKNIKLSLIIPCYNEEIRLKENLKEILKFMNSFKSKEIIFVNDGSQDNTLDILKKIKTKTDFIKIISYKKNKGKGYALKRGILNSKYELILISDVDLSTPLTEFEKLYKDIKNYDIIIGSRNTKKSNIKIKQSKIKILLGKTGNLLIKTLLNLNLNDTQCGFKLFKNNIKPIFQKSLINGFGYDFEILFLANKNKYSIKENGVIWINDTRSKVKPLHYIKTLIELLKVRLNWILRKY